MFCLVVFFVAWSFYKNLFKLGGDHHNIADLTINLTGIPVREHCTSCHPNGRLIKPAAGNDVQSGAHPDISPHVMENIGCTGCHLGEGMAVDPVISHGLPGFGSRMILAKKDVQASCYACHELQPLKGADNAWSGYRLFLQKGCDSCHYADGEGLAGRYGPSLSTVGSYLGLKKLQKSIRYPKKDPINSIMPRFPLSAREAGDISYFLKSRINNPAHVTPMIKKVKEKKPVEDAQLHDGSALGSMRKYKCFACHKFQDEDGLIAPDLSFMSDMRDTSYLRDFLKNPQIRIPGAIMPVVSMDQPEEQKIINFLSGGAHGKLKKRDGQSFYMAFCQRCHAADGNGKGPIQPNLSGLPRPFLNNRDFYRYISEERILSSINKGIPGTSMPPYGTLLNKKEIDDLIDLLFGSFIEIERKDKTQLAPLPVKNGQAADAGKIRTIYRKKCVRCHGKAGTGTGPEHLKHLPKPRNFTNRLFFASINDNRIARAIHDGIPGTAMPSFHEQVRADELWGLVSLVRRFSMDNEHETD